MDKGASKSSVNLTKMKVNYLRLALGKQKLQATCLKGSWNLGFSSPATTKLMSVQVSCKEMI